MYVETCLGRWAETTFFANTNIQKKNLSWEEFCLSRKKHVGPLQDFTVFYLNRNYQIT